MQQLVAAITERIPLIEVIKQKANRKTSLEDNEAQQALAADRQNAAHFAVR